MFGLRIFNSKKRNSVTQRGTPKLKLKITLCCFIIHMVYPQYDYSLIFHNVYIIFCTCMCTTLIHAIQYSFSHMTINCSCFGGNLHCVRGNTRTFEWNQHMSGTDLHYVHNIHPYYPIFIQSHDNKLFLLWRQFTLCARGNTMTYEWAQLHMIGTKGKIAY